MSQRQNPAGDAFTDDDATIAAALEAASVPCLLMSMIHMSGDASILDGDLRPVMCFLNEMQCAMSPDAQAEVRRRALAFSSAHVLLACPALLTRPPPRLSPRRPPPRICALQWSARSTRSWT